MPLTDVEIRRYNKLGLIPGPYESETDFLARVDYCLHLEKHLAPSFEHFPFSKEAQAQSKDQLEEAITLTHSLYGISPSWVPLFYSNARLAPWHGGCAWIFQMTEQTPTSALLQLRTVWKNKETFLGLYSRKELLAHELSHVGRMMYQEKKYEELLAYQSSSSSWQRWLGPIIQSSHEAMLFMSFVCLAVIADLFLLFSGYPQAWGLAAWLKLIPVLFIFYGLWRLQKKHRFFKQAKKNLQPIVENPQAVLYRLTDVEITAFAKMTPTQIKEYATRLAETDLRWRFIYIYFN